MPPRPLSCLWRRCQSAKAHPRPTAPSRPYSANTSDKTSSRHAQFYADYVPAMIPVALLGSAVYLSLRLAQAHLSHDKFLEEARARVAALEEEIDALRTTPPIKGGDAQISSGVAGSSRWWSW